MVKHYQLFAMGIKSGLRFRKRAMNHFYNASAPVRKLVISGKSVDMDFESREPKMEIQPYRPKMSPMKFNF